MDLIWGEAKAKKRPIAGWLFVLLLALVLLVFALGFGPIAHASSKSAPKSVVCTKSTSPATATYLCRVHGHTGLRVTATANMASSLMPAGSCVSKLYQQIVPPTFKRGRIGYTVLLRHGHADCTVRLLFAWSYKPTATMMVPLRNFFVSAFQAESVNVNA